MSSTTDAIGLIVRHLEGDLSSAEFASLNALLRTSDEARRAYRDLLDRGVMMRTALNAELGTRNAEPLHAAAAPVPISEFRVPRFAYAAAATLLLAAAALAIYVVAFNSKPDTRNPTPAASAPVATVIDTADGTLIVNDDVVTAGQTIRTGDVALDAGSADFRIHNGVEVRLVGATELRVIDGMHAALARGSATFDCPPEAKGYAVTLPGGVRVVDLGTRFRVTVDTAGDAVVHVIDGRVRIEGGNSLELAAGWIGRVEGNTITSAPAGALHDAGFEAAFEATDTDEPTPAAIGRWTGDPATIVQAVNDIAPAEGARMLRFDATHRLPARLDSRIGQVYQIVDLTALADDIDAHRVTADLSADFNRVRGNERTDTRFGVRLVALPPPSAGDPPFPGAAGATGDDRTAAEFDTDDDPATWQRLGARLALPVGTRFLLVELRAVENRTNDTATPEFDGHFADDARLVLDTVARPRPHSPHKTRSPHEGD